MTAFMSSEIIIMVERNLAFDAEHHHRALNVSEKDSGV